MKILVMVELLLILIVFSIKYIIRLYQKHKDKTRVKTVLNYLHQRTGNIEVEKLQKMLGVDDDAIKNKNKKR